MDRRFKTCAIGERDAAVLRRRLAVIPQHAVQQTKLRRVQTIAVSFRDKPVKAALGPFPYQVCWMSAQRGKEQIAV